MDLGLKGKAAIVTGGGSGLGRETAHYLGREGMKVLIADINEKGLAKVLGELREAGARAESFKVDVSKYAQVEAMVQAGIDAFGAVDVMIACAGIVGEGGFFAQSNPKNWDAVLDINVRGVMNCSHAVAKHMFERKSGAIVNVASEAGKVGEKRMVVYSASKGAVIGFTKAFSCEAGRYGVRVNAVAPGVTNTPMTAGYTDEQKAASAKFYPMGRLGEPEDIAAMITFLASDQTSWVTGQVVSVSGGFGRS